ncbi:hypothetical protein ACIHFC_26770 [Streptomyces sp. NPDC052013]
MRLGDTGLLAVSLTRHPAAEDAPAALATVTTDPEADVRAACAARAL